MWTDAPVIMTERAIGNWCREKRIWEENIYPIGNGRLGTTVFGEPKIERMQFNEDSLSGKVTLGNVHEIPITSDGEDLVMKGDTSKFWWWGVQTENEETLLAGRKYASDKLIILDFEARVRVIHEGGSVRMVDNALVFDQCEALTIFLAADTNYLNRRDKGWRGPHPHERVSLFARPYDSERAYKVLTQLMATHVYSNCWTTLAPFQIDANFGYAAGVNEMLIQSHMGTIELLPALPKEWTNGSVTGMRVRGVFELNLEWKDGKLTAGALRSLKGQPCRLHSTTPITITGKGKEIIIERSAAGVLSFETEPGASYILSPVAK